MKRRMKSFLEGLGYQQESPGQMREELSHTFLKGTVLKGARASELRDRQESISGMFFFPSPLLGAPVSQRAYPDAISSSLVPAEVFWNIMPQ